MNCRISDKYVLEQCHRLSHVRWVASHSLYNRLIPNTILRTYIITNTYFVAQSLVTNLVELNRSSNSSKFELQ